VAFGAMFISEGMDTDSYHRGDENDILAFTVVDFTEGRSAANFEIDLANLLTNFVQSCQSVETFAIDEAEVEPVYENSRNVRLYFTCEFDLSPSSSIHVTVDPDELEASEWHPLRESPAAIVRYENSLVIWGTRMRLAMDRTAADLVELSLLPSDSPELSMVLDKRRGRSDEEFRQHVSWLLEDMEAMPEIILSEIRGGEIEGGRRVMVTVEFLGIEPVLNGPILNQFGHLEERREEESESPLA